MSLRHPSAAIALLAIVLAGCVDPDEPDADVVATDHEFTPDHLDVSAGDTVTWVNEGDAPHTVSIPEGQAYIYDEEFESGERLEYTFDEPGEYRVVCTYHPGMEMMVHVD